MKTFSKVIAIMASVILGLSLISGIIGLGMYGWNFKNARDNYSPTRLDLTNINDSFDNITSVDAQLSIGEVYIKSGDKFTLDAKNVPKNSLSYEVKNNVLVIRQNDFRNPFKWFNFNFFSFGFNNHANLSQVVTITVTDAVMNRFNLDAGIGEVQVAGVNSNKMTISTGVGDLVFSDSTVTEDLNLNVGTGQAEIYNVKLNNSYIDAGLGDLTFRNSQNTGITEIDVGTGEAEINDITAYDFKLDCGLGSAYIENSIISKYADISIGTGDFNFEGELNCNSKIDVGLGSCDMQINGNEDDYSYDLDVDLGDAKVNGNRRNGNYVSENSKYLIEANVDTGDLEINFR